MTENTEKPTKSRRFKAVVWAIVMSSLVAGYACHRGNLTGSQCIELYKIYAFLMAGLCGAYQTAQSVTDTKKIKKIKKIKRGGSNE